MEKIKPKSLHVLMDPDEFTELERLRGNLSWKAWLFSFQEQLRTQVERVALYKRQLELVTEENERLNERIKILQEKAKDA